jgi:hypothetical protein
MKSPLKLLISFYSTTVLLFQLASLVIRLATNVLREEFFIVLFLRKFVSTQFCASQNSVGAFDQPRIL